MGAILVSSYNLVYGQDVHVLAFNNMTSGQMVYPDDTIKVELNIENLGTTIIGMNDYDSLPVSLYANGKLIAKSFFANQPWMVSQIYSMALLTKTNYETYGDYSIDSGVVSLCAKTFIWKNNVNIDIDQSNDELCLPTIIYIGPPGTGIKNRNVLNNNIYYSRGQLNIEFSELFKGSLDISVIDVNGRVLKETSIVASNQRIQHISIPNLPTGIYIANIVSDGGDRGSIKFMVE